MVNIDVPAGMFPHSIFMYNCTELRSFKVTFINRYKIVEESISGVAEYLIKIV